MIQLGDDYNVVGLDMIIEPGERHENMLIVYPRFWNDSLGVLLIDRTNCMRSEDMNRMFDVLDPYIGKPYTIKLGSEIQKKLNQEFCLDVPRKDDGWNPQFFFGMELNHHLAVVVVNKFG